jgi:hypothetical protein
MAKDKDTHVCAKFDCATGVSWDPGNLSGLSGFEWGFSRDPWCLCRVSVCFCGVFRGLCGKSMGLRKSIRSLTA